MPRIFGRGRNPPAPQDRQVDGIPLAEVVESRGMRVASLSTADQQDWEVVHGYADGVIDGVPVVVEPFAAGASDYAYAVAVPISPGVGALGPMGAVVEMGVFAPHRALGIVDGADDGEGVVIDGTIRRIVTRELVSNGHPLIGPMMVNRMLFLRTAWQGLRAQDLSALASSSRIFHRYIAPLHALWRHVLILEHFLHFRCCTRDGSASKSSHRTRRRRDLVGKEIRGKGVEEASLDQRCEAQRVLVVRRSCQEPHARPTPSRCFLLQPPKYPKPSPRRAPRNLLREHWVVVQN